MKKSNLLLIIFVLVSTFSFAQSGIITGTVNDGEYNDILPWQTGSPGQGSSLMAVPVQYFPSGFGGGLSQVLVYFRLASAPQSGSQTPITQLAQCPSTKKAHISYLFDDDLLHYKSKGRSQTLSCPQSRARC